MILIVLMKFTYIIDILKSIADSINTLQFKQMMNLRVC